MLFLLTQTQTHKIYFRENLLSASTLPSPQCLTLLRGNKEEPRRKNRLRIMMIQQKQHSECAIKGLHKVADFLSNGREGQKEMMQSKGKMGEEERSNQCGSLLMLVFFFFFFF